MRLELATGQSLVDLWVWLGSFHPLLLVSGILLATPFVFVAGFIVYFAGLITTRVVTDRVLGIDTYHHLPTPKLNDWLFPLIGNIRHIRNNPPTIGHLKWIQQLKTRVYTYRGIFYTPSLFLGDTRAMAHILGASNSYSYPKPGTVRLVLKNLLGEGVLIAEGDVHKRQRKILQPAFAVSAVRDLVPTFFQYSDQLAAKFGEMVDRSVAGPGEKNAADGVNIPFKLQTEAQRLASKPGAPVIDTLFWLSRATLDVIGDAGFSHKFGGLNAQIDPNEPVEESDGEALNIAFKNVMNAAGDGALLRFMQLYLSTYPGLGWIGKLPTKRQRDGQIAYNELFQISLGIINRKRAEILKEIEGEVAARGGKPGAAFTKADFDEKPEAHTTAGKDLLHLMMRANLAADVSPKEKLQDHELVGQITTLLLAGNETTSTQTAWALHVLAGHPEAQAKLRAEIHEHFGADMAREIGYDELMGMRYLDCVAKEMMRFISPVPNTVRLATANDVVPLSRPYPTRDGKSTFDSVPIRKGQQIFIPIQALNLSEEIWGPTAQQFDPERWYDDNLPDSARNNGFPLHLMTFISGPRGCIGNRFAIAEFKALLCSLIGRFNFEQVEGWEVEQKQAVTVRPRIKGMEKDGQQMPLRVSRI